MLSSSKSPFAIDAYRKLFLAHSVSVVGTGITTIALALLAWKLADNQAGKVLGTALAIKMLVYVVMAPVAASFAHKISGKQWLIVLDIIRAVLIFYLPFVSRIWEVYLLLLFVSACSAAYTPVFQATIAGIVKGDSQYKKALSYSRLIYDLEQLLSPALASLLLAVMSFNELFILDAISFLFSALLIYLSVFQAILQTDRPGRYFDDLIFGISSYLKTPRLRALLALYLTVACASSMMITGTVVYVSDLFSKAESSIAVAMAMSGGGSIMVALFLPKLLEFFPIRYSLCTGAVILVTGMFVAGSGPNWPVFLAVWFFLGAGLSFIQVPAGALVRVSCRQDDSTAYFAANFSLSHLCWLVAYPVAGHVGAQFGLHTAFFLMGGIASIAAFCSWKMYPNPDESVLEHTHQEFDHCHYHRHDDHHDPIEIPDQKCGMYQHRHQSITHKHTFVIDAHHLKWP